jgi:hypothetical protein
VIYFDNLPETHHGSSWQQTWAILHLPLHLSFVGILEGSRQVAMMRFISQAISGFVLRANKNCLQRHLDGQALGEKLFKIIDVYDFGILHPTAAQYIQMRDIIEQIEKVPGICSATNTTNVTSLFDNDSPPAFVPFKNLLSHFTTALFVSDGAEEILPTVEESAFALLDRSVKIIYLYYWSSVLVMLLTIIFLYRLTNTKAYKDYDVADLCSMLGRWVMALLAASLIALYGKKSAWTDFVTSRAMLPTLCGILSFVVVVDRLGRLLRARSLRKKLPPGTSALTEEQDANSSWLNLERDRDSHGSRLDGVVMLEPRNSVYSWLMPEAEQLKERHVDQHASEASHYSKY